MQPDEAKIQRALARMDDSVRRAVLHRKNRKKILASLPLEVRRNYLVAVAIAKAEGKSPPPFPTGKVSTMKEWEGG